MVKNLPTNAEDVDSILRSGRSPGERIGYLFQYSWASLVAQMVKKKKKKPTCNVRDLGLIPRSRRFPREGNDYHSITPAWEIPWTEEPGRLQSTGL